MKKDEAIEVVGDVVEIDDDELEVVHDVELVREIREVKVIEGSEKDEILAEVLMSKEDATRLTMDIQSTSAALYVLLKQAHDEKAWVALGYNSWTSYIEGEFEFSRARSYQLINQASVIEEINEASGVPLYITEREARSIKSRLPNITEKLEKKVKDSNLPEDEAKDKALEIIREDPDDEIDIAKGYQDSDSELSEQQYDDGSGSGEWEDKGDFKGNSGELSDEDMFFYDNLEATLKIFQAMPDATSFGKLVKYSNLDRKPISNNAQSAIEWISRFLGELD